MEDVKLKVFIMNKWISESMKLAKHISRVYRREFNGSKCNSRQNWNNDKCQRECNKPIKYHICEERYVWNPRIRACECDKDCEFVEYWNDSIWMLLSIVLWMHVGSCEEIADTPETTWINPGDGMNYWRIAVVLIVIACLLLLVAIVVKYYIKRGLTIPCLSSYYYIEISKVRDTNIKNLNTFPIIWSVSTIPIRIILRWMKNHIKISLFPTLVMWIQIAHALYTLLSTKQTDILKKVIEINICRKFQLTKAETSWKFIIKC